MIISGQKPFQFIYREDLRSLPKAAISHESNLHGAFAVDKDTDGRIFYGMPNFGLMAITPDLKNQDVIELPNEIKSFNSSLFKILNFFINVYIAEGKALSFPSFTFRIPKILFFK